MTEKKEPPKPLKIISLQAENIKRLVAVRIDSDIFKDVFGTAEMRAVFSDDSTLKTYVQAEIALAVAQGKTGVIPAGAAREIEARAASVALDRTACVHRSESSHTCTFPVSAQR